MKTTLTLVLSAALTLAPPASISYEHCVTEGGIVRATRRGGRMLSRRVVRGSTASCWYRPRRWHDPRLPWGRR